MRARALVPIFILLVTVFAGCIESEPWAPAEKDPYLPTADAPFQVVEGSVNALGASFSLSAEDLEFEETLLRFALVAESDLGFEVNVTSPSRDYREEDGCFVVAMYKEGMAFNLIGWAAESSHRTSLDVDGTRQDLQVYGEGSSGSDPTFSELSLSTLGAGEIYMIEVGGRDASYLRGAQPAPAGDGQEDAHSLSIKIDVVGDAKIVALPPATIKCGVGPGQAQGLVQVNAPRLQRNAVAAEISLSTSGNATLYWNDLRAGREEMEPLRQVTIDYGDERFIDSEWITRSQPGSLDMTISYDHTFDWEPVGSWLLSDVYWPFLGDDDRPYESDLIP